jgi:hypothetical protein
MGGWAVGSSFVQRSGVAFAAAESLRLSYMCARDTHTRRYSDGAPYY